MKSRTVGLVAPALCVAIAGACCFQVLAGTPAQMPAFGLQHTGIGQAQLSGSSNHLVVSNIGSSGKDGVSIDLGETQGFRCALDFGPASQQPPGLVGQFDVLVEFGGPGAGQDQKAVCCVFHEDSVGQGALTLDLSDLPPDAVRVDAVLDGQIAATYELLLPLPVPLVVDDATEPPAKPGQLVVSNIGSSGKDGVGAGGAVFDVFFEVCYESHRLSSVAGNPVVMYDELRFTISRTMPSEPVRPFRRAEMRASVPSGVLYEFAFVDEAIELFDVPHRALGEAHMNASGGTLTISNIGSSGKDGVSQDPLPPGTGSVIYELALPAPPAGPIVIGVNSSVSLAGLPPGQPITRTLYGDGVNPLEIVVDFSSIGATTMTMELFLDDQLVFQQSGMAGVLATVRTPPPISGTESQDDQVVQTFTWLQPTPLTIPGGPTLQADHLRVIPELGSGADSGEIDFVEVAGSGILAAGIDTLIIINEAAVPGADPCPWDCGDPQDGDVGVVDFLALLAQWGQAGAPCDFDGAGVGVTDFLELLASWGACP